MYSIAFSSVGRVDDAIKEFMLLKTIDISILCSFAKAFYKAKQYGQALKCKKYFVVVAAVLYAFLPYLKNFLCLLGKHMKQ